MNSWIIDYRYRIFAKVVCSLPLVLHTRDDCKSNSLENFKPITNHSQVTTALILKHTFVRNVFPHQHWQNTMKYLSKAISVWTYIPPIKCQYIKSSYKIMTVCKQRERKHSNKFPAWFSYIRVPRPIPYIRSLFFIDGCHCMCFIIGMGIIYIIENSLGVCLLWCHCMCFIVDLGITKKKTNHWYQPCSYVVHHDIFLLVWGKGFDFHLRLIGE